MLRDIECDRHDAADGRCHGGVNHTLGTAVDNHDRTFLRLHFTSTSPSSRAHTIFASIGPLGLSATFINRHQFCTSLRLEFSDTSHHALAIRLARPGERPWEVDFAFLLRHGLYSDTRIASAARSFFTFFIRTGFHNYPSRS